MRHPMFTFLLLMVLASPLMARHQHTIVPGPVSGYELNPQRGAWAVVIPQETTNYVPNPSGELTTTGWTGNLGTVVSQVADAYSGQYSIQSEGTIATLDSEYLIGTLTANQYTYSAWLKAKAGSARLTPIIGGVQGNAYDFFGLSFEGWTRVTLTLTLPTTTTLAIRYSNRVSSELAPIRVDAQQLEIGPYATTAFDGDSGKDYVWTAAPHASASVRLASASDGGRIKRFEEFGFRVKGYTGASMPVHDAARQPYGILDGALYQGTRVTERQLAILGDFGAPDIQGLQRQKDALIRAINRDTNLTDSPLTLRYQLYDCGEPRGVALNLRASYIGGMDGNTSNNYQEEAMLQFRADDPFFYEAEQRTAALTTSQSVTDAFRIIMADRNNAWSALSFGLFGGTAPFAMARGLNGALYVGGDFTSASGVANTAFLAVFLNGTWSSVGVVTGGAVRAIAVGPDGAIYIGGDFTAVNGVANTLRVARYRPSTGVWSAIGASGANAAVRALAFDNAGTLYAGGDFTNIGGSGATYMAATDGVTWVALSSQPNNSVFTLTLAPGGAMVAGGLFTTVGATSANRIAAYTPVATWVTFGTGMATGVVDAPIVRDVAFLNGILYATGNFVSAGGNTVNHIAMWNGSAWRPLATGLSLTGLVGAGQGGYSLAAFNNVLHVGGRYTAAGALTYIFEGYARWNGTAWILADVNLPSSPTVTSLFADALALVVGFDSTGTADTSANTTVTVNATANSYPFIRVINGDPTTVRRLYQLVNVTTGDALYFDLNVLVGEIITIDLSPDAKTVTSNLRGQLNGAVLAGSTLSRWRLAPKTTTRTTNTINVLMGGTPAQQVVRMFWNNRHWAVEDAVL